MKASRRFRPLLTSLAMSALLLHGQIARGAAAVVPPDLTAAGVIPKIDSAGAYNLGPTGMRGWFHISGGYGTSHGQDGTMTDVSRQILVTVVGADTPATGVLAVDDVILGVAWGKGGGPVPAFTSDARKSFGAAISEAENTENAGILRLIRWRAGVATDVAITLAVMGSYSDSADRAIYDLYPGRPWHSHGNSAQPDLQPGLRAQNANHDSLDASNAAYSNSIRYELLVLGCRRPSGGCGYHVNQQHSSFTSGWIH